MPGQKYIRVGRVTATRLTQARDWQTVHGDVLHAEAGDWIVMGDDGAVRTVKDLQFRASYAHVADDVWQRTGEVTAWRTDRELVVRTLEGAATAKPGDWILTSPDGATWPVPDQVFQAGYRPA